MILQFNAIIYFLQNDAISIPFAICCSFKSFCNPIPFQIVLQSHAISDYYAIKAILFFLQSSAISYYFAIQRIASKVKRFLTLIHETERLEAKGKTLHGLVYILPPLNS
jgi:hypothetical protein